MHAKCLHSINVILTQFVQIYSTAMQISAFRDERHMLEITNDTSSTAHTAEKNHKHSITHNKRPQISAERITVKSSATDNLLAGNVTGKFRF